MKQSSILLDQIIEMARAKDALWKDLQKKLHKSNQTIGDDTIIFHLERLKELLAEESR